jgi:hypothetical protein
MKIIILTLIFVTSLSHSQNGPIVPDCSQCENINLSSKPHNGIWWSPDLSGVGVSIEVQDNKLFGTYYGYDNNGKSTWYTFLGDLTNSDNPQVMWDVLAPIRLFENGVCFNCEYQTPRLTEFDGSIHIQFNHNNHASISINGGEAQNIVPFLFAEPASADFINQTNYKIPYLDGTWSFSFINLPVHEFNPIQSRVLHLSDTYEGARYIQEEENGTTSFHVTGYSTDVGIGVLSCRTYIDSNDGIAGPICALFGSIDDQGKTDGYYVNIADIGPKRIIGKKENGDTIEAYKLDFSTTQD